MNEFNITGSGEIEASKYSTIGENVQIIFNKPGTVTIGDYCTIGNGVKIICSGGDVNIGDWTSIHDNSLILSGRYVEIGEHCWFGQNCILDGSGGLAIGRGVRVGMYSQIWSHVAAGEQIEGCTLFGERPVEIADDVWLVGSCIVASGVSLGRRTVALIGSNITKSHPENSVLAGTPASAKQGLSFYRDVSLSEKREMLESWISQAIIEFGLILEATDPDKIIITDHQEGRVIFANLAATARNARSQYPLATVCCIEDKTYNKQFTSIERKILKFLSGNKARFFCA